jgi:hypothetical protein
MFVAPMQKKDDLPVKEIQKYGFLYFLELFGMCTLIVIPFWYLYDAIWFSDILIWYMEWLGE